MKSTLICMAMTFVFAVPSAEAAMHHLEYRGASILDDPGFGPFRGQMSLDTALLGRDLVDTTVSWQCLLGEGWPNPEEDCSGDFRAATNYAMFGGLFGTLDYQASFSMTFDESGRITDWYVWSMDDPYEFIAGTTRDGIWNYGDYGTDIWTNYWSEKPGTWYLDGSRASGLPATVPLPAGLAMLVTALGCLGGFLGRQSGKASRSV